jgi:hypothetical protein
MAAGTTGGDAETIDIDPRSPGQIAGRLIIQATLLRRVMLELEFEESGDEGLDESRFDDIAILIDRKIWDDAAAWERDFLETAVGQVDDELLAQGTTSLESTAVLLWAIGLLEIDITALTAVDPRDFAEFLPQPDAEIDEIAENIEVQDPQVLWDAREALDVWSWRLSIEMDLRSEGATRSTELDSVIREVSQEAVEIGMIAAPVLSDLPFEGTPVKKLPLETIEEAAGIAMVRLTAINWVCGLVARWGDDAQV